MSYSCVPEFMKAGEVDPFNYPLRKPEEIKEQHRLRPPSIDFCLDMKTYMDGDFRYESNHDHRG
jgi:hypothetical protein